MPTVRVVFLDDASGEVIGRSDVDLGQLPEELTGETRLQLGDTRWLITRAEPTRKAEFEHSGVLRLTLRRLDSADPHELLFSMPTICAVLPRMNAGAVEVDEPLRIREDEWRQVEFVSRELSGVVEAQLAEIRAIYDSHSHADEAGEVSSFNYLHTREEPVAPLEAAFLSRAELQTLMPGDAYQLAGVAFWDRPGRVADGFAFDLGPLAVYGIAPDEGEVSVLGVHLWEGKSSWSASDVPGCLTQLMRGHQLVLADWCRCAALPPEAIPVWLLNLG